MNPRPITKTTYLDKNINTGKITPAGFFKFSGIDISSNTNNLHLIATDESGNKSQKSNNLQFSKNEENQEVHLIQDNCSSNCFISIIRQ